MKEMGRKSWYRNYEAFFDEALGIKWANSGVDLDLIEQGILARNDFTHNPDLLSVHSYQTEFHSKKHPNSVFIQRDWPALLQRKVLHVSAEDLTRAVEAIRQFAAYLERERRELVARLRSQAK